MTTARPLTTILLALSMRDSNEWLRLHPQPGNVHVVTPSNVKRGAGRGLTADRILETPAVKAHAARREMREVTRWALVAGSSPAIGQLELETVQTVRIRNAPQFILVDDKLRGPGVHESGNVYIIEGENRQLVYRIIGRSVAHSADVCQLLHDSDEARP